MRRDSEGKSRSLKRECRPLRIRSHVCGLPCGIAIRPSSRYSPTLMVGNLSFSLWGRKSPTISVSRAESLAPIVTSKGVGEFFLTQYSSSKLIRVSRALSIILIIWSSIGVIDLAYSRALLRTGLVTEA